jgi:hypothetical protein
MWDFSNLFSGLGSGGGSASAFGGLGTGGGLGGLTGDAASSVAQQQGVGSNPFGFTQGGGQDFAMDPKLLQGIMSMANGTGGKAQGPGGAGVAPRGQQVQLTGTGTPPAQQQFVPAQRLSLRNLIYGGT